jgi:hypothetical protein
MKAILSGAVLGGDVDGRKAARIEDSSLERSM